LGVHYLFEYQVLLEDSSGPAQTDWQTRPANRPALNLITPRHCHSEEDETMAGSDKRKQSLYFPEEMLKEIQAEAVRQDRSLSWLVQKAWRVARNDIMKMPAMSAFLDGEIDKQ
jgi:uncharacterized small protein (TIGR04563 family)